MVAANPAPKSNIAAASNPTNRAFFELSTLLQCSDQELSALSFPGPVA